jgi:predicted HTH domain antitoxin
VDAAELRSHVGKPPLPGMSARQVIIELGASHATVRALIDNGVLPAKRAINPVGHTPVSLVARADLDAFRRKYVTLAHLAKAHRKQPRAMRLELERRGIHPAPELDKQTYEVIFYRRADLEA